MRKPATPAAVVALLAVPALALAMLACIPLDDPGTSSSSGGSSTDAGDGGEAGTLAGKACLDTATAYATAAQRCGGNFDIERTAFIRDLANGDCDSVTIRNETELRTQCIPSFDRISCADLTQQRFPPSCAEQIIRTK